MKKWVFLLVVFGAGILQVVVLDHFRFFNVKPDLLLACAVISGLSFELKWALFFSILAGLFKDTFGITPFGLNALLFPLWSFLIIKISRQISLESNVVRLGLAFIILCLHNIVTCVVFIYSGRVIPPGIFLRIIVLSSVYTQAIILLVFRFIP